MKSIDPVMSGRRTPTYNTGYIQTPGWHPFARPFRSINYGVAAIIVPSNHVTLISVVYNYANYADATVCLLTVSRHRDRPRKIWEMARLGSSHPGGVQLSDVTEFCLKFSKMQGDFFRGIRVIFSFHRSMLALQQRAADGLWNCSVPSWLDFHLHFICNHKVECAGREDEQWCPDTSCHQEEIALNESCYVFLRLPPSKNTWHHANRACKQRGAALATLPTVNSWYHLAVLSQTKKYDDMIYIGLQSSDASKPYMYRYALQWYNDSISHYALFQAWVYPPSCFVIWQSVPRADSCGRAVLFSSLYALCRTMPPSVVSPKRIAQGETRHWPARRAKSSFSYSHRETFPSISCPAHHRTQDFLACDAFSACWHDRDNGFSEFSLTASNTRTSVCSDASSFKALFPCRKVSGYVPCSLVCNHLQDCADNSDEDFCVFPSCSALSQYTCDNGRCLQLRHLCDDIVQCMDESDEVYCFSNEVYRIGGEVVVRPRPPVVADFTGRGWMVYTPLTTGTKTSTVLCPDTHVFCPGEGYCLPVYVRCNGLYDCPGREDELDCVSYTCPAWYRCRGLLNTCLHPDHLCDGWPQCPQHDDEVFCNLTCPVHCTCLGHAFTCNSDFHVELFSRLRYLDARGSGLKPGRLVNNKILVYLSLANCGLAHLDNLNLSNVLSLDLSDNRFSVLTVSELNFMNLQNLSIARNPLSTLFSGNYSSDFHVHKGILHVDLAGVGLQLLDMPSYLPFPSLIGLNLSESGITRLIGDGFRSLTSLRILDLRGCPMTVFPRYVFKDLKNLQLVFADNYKLCCKASLPVGFNMDNCQAPFNEISSCDALLRTDVFRVCLSVLAALALSGNLGCFFLRIFSLTGRGKTGFRVFVTHLCVSDFVMGVYMAMVGVADRLYMGRYLWVEDRWRHSAACQVAGILAFLSSEVSAFIICLITLDRFLVIRFPFSRLRYSPFSAQVASFMAWTVGVALVTVPLMSVTGFTHFYGQSGICVPLPITRNSFSGHHYAFGVMILLNLVVFLLIASGQISVYLSMTNNAMSAMDTTRKSRDLIVARRLITVVVSDFLCWFPLGLLGVLASQGVPVSGEVSVAMAIFVLPLNSALNPFLYTLNTIQEKRQRAAEMKLLKVITDRGIG